jgi:hypothetical protein
MRVMGPLHFNEGPCEPGARVGWFRRAECGQCEGLLAGRICASAFTATRGNVMYIGVGTIVLIILVVLLILFLRRRA